MSVTTVVIAVVAVLALIALVVMRLGKARPGDWETAPAALGLQPMSALDPALTDAIISLHRPPVAATVYEQKQTWSLTRIYRYPEPDVDCYSVTVHLEQSGEIWQHGATMRSETKETRIVAVVGPKTLEAPRMHLMPRAVVAPSASKLATLAAEAANALLDVAPDHVEFADDPTFERRYLVLSSQASPARAFLTSARRQALAGLEGVQVSLEGSLLLVSSLTDAIQHRGRSLEESLRAELETARRVLRLFNATTSSAP